MLRKLLSTLIFVFAAGSLALAQSGSVTGTVTDAETGDVVPGANVYIMELERGAPTDAEGEYTIENIAPGTYTFRVTFVGYQAFRTQITIEPGEELTQDVVLEPGAIGLDELVVTGYGVETKRESTGSIAQVSSEDFENIPIQNTEAILQGRAAGVQVTSTSGNPGGGFQVRVRGIGSINAGSTPLYIVDGTQVSFQNQSETTDESPLNSINPNDIASIEVLKDAAAAAIYGSQAANGVVLITTKRGQEGPTQISASVEYGVRANNNTYELLTGPEWTRYIWEANGLNTNDEQAMINFAAGYEGFDAANVESVDQIPTQDWEEFFYQNGISRKANLTASGGDEDTRFYIGANVEDTEGSVETNTYTSYSLRTNFDHTVNQNLSTSLNINLSNQKHKGIVQDGPIISAPISAAAFMPPVYTPFLHDQPGEYNPNSPFGASTNPQLVLDERIRNSSTTAIFGNWNITYNFTDWLSLRTSTGMDYRIVKDITFSPPILSPGDNGDAGENAANTTNLTHNTVLNFRQTFNDVHNITGMIGGEYRRDFSREVSASSIGFSTGNLLTVVSAGATPDNIQGIHSEFRIASYFGQLKYNYDDRYAINTTLRYDGSSRFGSDNRWGFFPSGAVAWTVSEEDFFTVDTIDDLKLRVSYGVTGNASIGNFAALGTYGTSGQYMGTGTLAPGSIENNLLTWEEAKEINIGLDWSILNSRFYGSFNVYQRDNESLLLDRPLPSHTGYDEILENVGTVRNQGFEAELNSINIDRGDFVWSSRFNMSVSGNEVLELNEGQEALGSGDTPIAVGHSILAWHLPEWAGVNPSDGRPMWYDQNGEITYQPTDEDRQYYGSAEQDFVGGFGNRFSYQGFSLDVFFQGTFGQRAFPAMFWYFLQTPSFTTNGSESLLRRWQEPGDVTDIPRQVVGDSPLGRSDENVSQPANWRTTESTQSHFKTDYIRLKTVSLSYNLPASITESLNLRGIRLYVVGNNLYTWTSWPVLDPEVTDTFTQASYPNALQVNGGIEIDF